MNQMWIFSNRGNGIIFFNSSALIACIVNMEMYDGCFWSRDVLQHNYDQIFMVQCMIQFPQFSIPYDAASTGKI